ncbi:MAG: beta-ketoacyl synthase N-terminal-like domain-containing protein [Nostoc sp.]|uniref:beta-ketoacyl synthase N-terminal-like domain-containing protein n=1 Tax=Nostoc sp. TaxID=1180 RepID=UPI002FF1676D
MNREPIAIIGIGCRFPGANNPEAFWQLLCNGVDAISEVPKDRWDVESFYDPDPTKPNKTNSRWGGFVNQADEFEPEFFGISPREAAWMDPQQRLLLEVAWEALEDAGQVPEHLSGTKTGVFIGIGTHDYSVLVWNNPINEPYATTGTGNCIAANRISYLLNLHGPSLAIDTACSSSLVTVHLACQSLWSGESTMALAGGVNVLFLPTAMVGFTKAGFLSADGRCKTFDAKADGYVRSEGAGVVVLKPLSQAIADRDPVYAVILGSAVNQDGRSNGLTAPNPRAQEALLREAYRQAGVSPGQIQYIEAHGTGTKLGDSMEIKALGAVLAEGRLPNRHCAIGSVKTNIGHLETAAGIAGLIKVALSLKHQQIPPSLHLQEANPYIPLDKLPLRVQQTLEPWPNHASPALAGVSSFSFGGTNAHVVMQEITVQIPVTSQVKPSLHLLTLSAQSENALLSLAQRYEEFLARHPEVKLGDVCFTANTKRSHFNYRLAVTAESHTQLREQFQAFATGKQTSGIVTGQVQNRNRPKIAFLFTGQGSQYINMGRQLYETQPTFRQVLQQCDQILQPYLEQPLLSVLYPEPDAPALLDERVYTQPALFALEYALAQLWRSWGIVPDLVMGHSLGEYVAACVAGVFSLEDGLKLVAARARLMHNLPSEGKMVVVFASQTQVAEAIQPYAQEVAIAAVNGPNNTVISGQRQAVEAVEAILPKKVKTKTLQVSQAFHSPLMEPILVDFEQIARQVTYSTPQISLISNCSGELITDEIASAEYWCRHIRQPVKFSASIETLERQGCKIFVEIGPKPILLGMGSHCLPEKGGVWLPSLRPGQQDWQQILGSLGQLYVQGVKVDWSSLEPEASSCCLHLPTYPWQRSRYWFEDSQNKQQPKESQTINLWASAVSAGLDQAQHCPLDLALHTHSVKQECLDRLTIGYILETLSSFGVYTQADQKYSLDSLLEQSDISSTYRKLLYRWLKKLVSFGILRQEEEIFVCDRPLADSQVNSILSQAKEVFQDTPFLLEYLQGCGDRLPDIITGKKSPLETLFPGGSLELAENLYQKWAVARYFNDIVKSIVESVVKVLPPGKQLRILEIGAGTGGTTASVLTVLPPKNSIYCFTDISDFFFIRASHKFQAYPFVHYGLLDIEQNPENFGYTDHSFDIVIATNVLHATRNLGKTLENVLSLLAPGGLLVLNEVTHDASWFDISTGLIEGWQGFEDQLRQDSPLLSQKQWEQTIDNSGFEKVVSFPEPGSIAEVLGQNVIVAQAPGFSVNQETTANSHVFSKPATEFPTSPVVFQKTESSFTWENLLAVSKEERQQTLESYLGEQVARVLGLSTSKLDLEKPLNQMGFDSLMAVDIKNRIEVNLGVAVPTAKFFQDISIRQMATQVFEHLTATPSLEPFQSLTPENTASCSDSKAVSLVKIQVSGAKPPFICIHPGGLDVSCYTSLVQYLGNEQPFYLLQPFELDYYQNFNDEQLCSSIEDIASRCIEVLHTIQPQGPYFLGGWSLGGCVAFEVAQQLHKQGHEVAFLALLDVVNLPVNDDSTLLSWFASYLGVRYNKELWFCNDNTNGFELDVQLNNLRQQAIAANIIPTSINLAEFRHLFQVYKTGVQTSLQQVQNYTPQIYPYPITLFQAHELLNDLNGVISKSQLDNKNWSILSTEPLDFHVVPGNHYTMFIEPHVQTLGERFTSCLNAIKLTGKTNAYF